MLGFKLNPELLNDLVAHKMPADEFCRLFKAAVDGEQNYLSKFVRPWNCRPPAHEWKELRKTVFARDDYTCAYCGERGGKLECGHIMPVSRGGEHVLENLTTACFKCNRSKRDKTVSEWRGPQ